MPLYLTDPDPWRLTLPVNCSLCQLQPHEGFFEHYHDAMEIIAVVQGSMDCTADSRSCSLGVGDVIVFNPYTVHSGFMTAKDTEYLCLTFLLSEVLNFPDSVLSRCVDSLETGQNVFDERYPAGGEDSAALFGHMERLYRDLRSGTPESEVSVLTELYGIFGILFGRHYRVNTESSVRKKSLKFLRQLSAYMAAHYWQPITTETAAQALFMSTSHFSHVIRQNFNLSFSEYLRKYRLNCAMRYGTDTPKSVRQISEAVGFTDYAYFSRAFKEYTGVAPGVYFSKRKRRSGK